MRFLLALGAGSMLLVLAASAFGGCVSGSSLDSGDGGLDGGSDGATVDGASDGATVDGGSDGAMVDASADSGFVCGSLGGSYDGQKACTTVADCTTVARGCHCGAQPIIGIAKSFSTVAEECETKAASQCALGCANFPGHVAEVGANDVDGGTITVLCDAGKCHTVLQ
jgi:hypothetical protein